MNDLKITFGMIVLNGEPFLRYNLRALYPFAHEIIVVEGAVLDARSIASIDGHSRDSTLATLQEFKRTEDKDNKLIIVTAEDEGYLNGFWPGEKDEQSNAYAKRATGNYLWQVDVDEFYKPGDMRAVISLLRENSFITAVSFPMITFFGGLSYWVDGWYLRRGASEYHRLFKWGSDFRYVTHRPPTVHDDKGNDLRRIKWIRRSDLLKKKIYLYHYSLLFPEQVREKSAYYGDASWAFRQKASLWTHENYLELRHPFRVHNVYAYPSWLNRFLGFHPEQINFLFDDIAKGLINIELRRTDDIEDILENPVYQIGKWLLIILDYPDRYLKVFLGYCRNYIRWIWDLIRAFREFVESNLRR